MPPEYIFYIHLSLVDTKKGGKLKKISPIPLQLGISFKFFPLVHKGVLKGYFLVDTKQISIEMASLLL